MTEFSVNTRNRFTLGLEDEETDLHELLEHEQEEKKRKADEAAEAAAKAKLASTKGKKDKRISSNVKSNKKINNKSIDKTNTQVHSTSSNNEKNITKKPTNYPRNDENRPPRLRNANPNRPHSNDNFEKPPQEFDNNRERRGGYRGGRGGRGGPSSRPRREFERHSGSDKTGIKAVEKRDGSGPHNWGDEIVSQLEQPSDAQADVSPEKVPEPAPVESVEEEKPDNVEAEQEAKQLTLDEWRAQQAPSKTKAVANLRKANEGTDTKQWKKTVALEKKKKGDHSDEEYEELTDDEDTAVEETKATLEKLNIQITFGDRRDRGRGGRGRGGFGIRGRDFRGGDRRGPRNDRTAPQIDSENFPSLGSK